MNDTHAAGTAVAPRVDDLLMFLAWSLILAFASTIEDDATVERERVNETFAVDFGALHTRNVTGSDMIVVECSDGNKTEERDFKKAYCSETTIFEVLEYSLIVTRLVVGRDLIRENPTEPDQCMTCQLSNPCK